MSYGRDREPETPHPLQSHQATDPTVRTIILTIFDCTVVLLPDGPTMMRWQGPTSPVHSSHLSGSWVAIQHRGEQSLEKQMIKFIYLLPTLCPPRCWIHISGRPRLSPSIYSPIRAYCSRDREPETSHQLQSHQATDPKVHPNQLYCSSAAWWPHNDEVARAHNTAIFSDIR